jgi:hypothetical protein
MVPHISTQNTKSRDPSQDSDEINSEGFEGILNQETAINNNKGWQILSLQV